MIAEICKDPTRWEHYALAGFLLFEFWLGRTKKTDASSSLDLILLVLRGIFNKRS